MRKLTDHIVNPLNDQLEICVLDKPGHGGASHEYVIRAHGHDICKISFQNGAIGEFGVNGVTHEALLAVVADRLRSFQLGDYCCRENAIALTKVEEAQQWLQSRTLARMRRGVEGTGKK